MSKVIIGKFGPSARQILDAALAVAQGSEDGADRRIHARGSDRIR